MRIKSFVATGVNGYLDFNLKFNDDLTFVTGINGTGKTSALNSIVAFLIPRFDFLSTAAFLQMSIDLEVENQTYKLIAIKNDGTTEIRCPTFKEDVLIINKFEPPEDVPSHRIFEYQESYHSNIIAINKSSPIISLIQSLPAPMYLGLERRSMSSADVIRRPYVPSVIRAKQHRGIFHRSIGQSLDEALFFAQQTFQENRRKELHLDEKIRKDLVLGLLDFDPIEFSSQRTNPTLEDFKNIEKARKNLEKLPALLRVDEKIISRKINPLLEFLEARKKIIEKKSPKGSKKKEEEDTSKLVAGIEWSFNKTHLSKLNFLSEMISSYNNGTAQISKRQDEFLTTVNSFLLDSAKSLKFNKFGELVFSLNTDTMPIERDLRTLSSGEIQLIVILAHLYFNPEVEKANVFIIDEPELSLHVQWQEKFVEAIMSASNDTQYIMATHAPSIILNKTSKCIEITPGK